MLSDIKGLIEAISAISSNGLIALSLVLTALSLLVIVLINNKNQ